MPGKEARELEDVVMGMTKGKELRAMDEKWFDKLVDQQKKACHEESCDRLTRPAKCEWIHNAGVRQERIERASETAGKSIGSWYGGNLVWDPRRSGLLSNKKYTLSLYHQKQSVDEECKPYISDEARKEHLRTGFMGTETILSHLLQAKKREVKEFRPLSPPLSWKPALAKPERHAQFSESTP